MDTKTEKKKVKRASKGKRKHIRLLKQEARKNSVPGNEPKKKSRPA